MILITGSRGQLGSEFIKQFENKYSVKGVGKEEVDITDFDGTMNYISELKPSIIIHCAAYTNVDGCENDKDTAFKVNAVGTRNVAMAAEKVGAKLVYISTDYVFDGEKKEPYNEFDRPNPISIYGLSKLAGEEFVKTFCSRYFIVRIAWLYGENGNNFVKTIVKLAKEKGEIDVVNDQRGNPTFTKDVVQAVEVIMNSEKYGTYHVTNEGIASWYDFACKIVSTFGIDCKVNPTTSDKFIRPAKRPKNSALDKMMLRLEFGYKMRHWEEAFEEFAMLMKGRI